MITQEKDLPNKANLTWKSPAISDPSNRNSGSSNLRSHLSPNSVNSHRAKVWESQHYYTDSAVAGSNNSMAKSHREQAQRLELESLSSKATWNILSDRAKKVISGLVIATSSTLGVVGFGTYALSKIDESFANTKMDRYQAIENLRGAKEDAAQTLVSLRNSENAPERFRTELRDQATFAVKQASSIDAYLVKDFGRKPDATVATLKSQAKVLGLDWAQDKKPDSRRKSSM